jgi:hypothetical protein
MKLLSIVVAGGALLGAAACTGSDGATTGPSAASTIAATTGPSAASTISATDPGDFRDEAQAICADVSSELRAVALRDGATPVEAANSLRSMVDANRDGVDRLRMVETPPQFEETFGSWLDLVDETAKYLEVGSLALRAGDDEAFAQALQDANDASVQASAAAQDLQLPECAFSG